MKTVDLTTQELIAELKIRRAAALAEVDSIDSAFAALHLESLSLSVSSLINAAADEYEIKPEKIHGRCRDDSACRARFAIWHAMREAGWTLEAIGDAFKRDHGTVAHGLNKAKKLLSSQRFSAFVERLQSLINPI